MADIINLETTIAGFNGDPSHTAVYSVPSASMQVAQAIINACWNEAQGNKATFTSKMTAALSTWLDGTSSPHVTAGSVSVPTITEPGVTIPASIDTSDILASYDSKYLELVAMLVDKFSSFRTTYFANESSAYTAAETWLRNAIADPSGLPPAVVAQLVGDDQARILADSGRAQDTVMAQFAARGFPLPPGAAASAVLQIEQQAQNALAETSRKIMILSVEMQKWNVETIMGLRAMAMDNAIKYITALASGPEMASKVIGVGYDAQSKLITSASSFYNARTQAAEAVSKVEQYNNSIALDVATKNQGADMQMIENKLKGLLTEAQSIAQMCTALYNNIHVGSSVNTSGSSTVNTSLA